MSKYFKDFTLSRSERAGIKRNPSNASIIVEASFSRWKNRLEYLWAQNKINLNAYNSLKERAKYYRDVIIDREGV